MARILSVDDEPLIRTFLRVTLESAGHEVTAVASGAEALDRLRAETFDLILLDLMMPGMSGEEFLTAREGVPGQRAPVIALTAFPGELRQTRPDLAAVLTKPIHSAHLLQVVADALCPLTPGEVPQAKPAPHRPFP